ncbi:ATP-binding protein [Clostridium sp. C2-6-12]|uniref:sensor histidine kinase n=1 Tax=Clostridium sp. C2-6-12 TaxID=2698832 RepID=UPI001FACEB4C|nr:ATP-binding protein [Clostridium sp. C2-6-12]
MEEIILLIVNLIFIIVLNLYITNIFESISKNNILKNEIALYEQKSKMQYEYYNNLEKKYKNSRKVIHDMKNHLQSIEQLYNLKENHIASEYAKDMYEMLEELGQKYYTNNKVLNIIVNDQAQKAELLDIKLKCQIGDINLDFIKDIDLTTIFANLFDNAREACIEVKDDKLINFKVDKFNEFIVINLSNTINEIPKENKNGIISKKKNHEGIGLVNVKKALEKYEGNMRIYYDQKLFKVNIVIPIV